LITKAELHLAAEAQGLRFDQAEKDYVILWILSVISSNEVASSQWAFKGGTCLRHCFYSGFRFSEDIDFSCQASEANVLKTQAILQQAAREVQEASGILIDIKDVRASDNQAQAEILLEYSLRGSRRRGLPLVQTHLTFDEPLYTPTERKRVTPAYSDLSDFEIYTYSKIEIVAEKMRALIQQQEKWPRPRDLYDLWYILCERGERFPKEILKDLFDKKCQVRSVPPDPSLLISNALRERNRQAWGAQLVPTVQSPPDYDRAWEEWVEICKVIF
jgi:predicted nucleotidyltransferase component of viral defense system